MTCAACGLNEARRQYRLFPGKRRFVRFGDLRGGTLAPVTHGAAPIANVMWNGWVRAERLRHLRPRQTRLRNPLVARRASVDDVHSGKPNLIDVRTIVGQQFFCIRPALRKSQVGALVLLPLTAKIFERRYREYSQKDHTRNRKDQARAIRYFAHLFSRHEFSRATPTTSLGLEKTFQQPSDRQRQL